MPPQHNLLRELQENNGFFDNLVDMIPARLYVAGNSGDDKYNPKYFKGQSKESKESRRARNKASKRLKLDPEKAETTNDVKRRLARENEQEEVHDDDNDSIDSDMNKKKESHLTPTKAPEIDDNKTQSSGSRIEALRAKLHAKLAEKQGNRPSNPNKVSKRAARRAEKQRRQEEGKKRRAMSKVEIKAKNQYVIGKNGDGTRESDLANLDFGKLTGLKTVPKNFENNKSLANINKTRNLQKMLADAEEKKKKLEELKRSESDADKLKAEKMAWSDTLKEATGERIKDDPNKIKKALKRKIAKKEKSTKAWKSRMEQTKQKMDERQNIRKHNLTKRSQGGAAGANLSKKRIVDSTANDGEEKQSSRKSRAGFEGKKKGFLNGKSKADTQ
mmetsp:Transcript_6431/g.9472  ORF Transcript_6431/g.9472 Transcript_6431/m.9472 type:complete len:388 (-) Transcript_6431:1725-2888(-)|eukprot:CAMPEP_0194222972 /NCGR_PEP_ID=MMETSP0156-20130528/34064_1 /TAXON_ID=33649 /ORGANISM="Thalassionema nitzschioides, Strain L26-B" /LENGTH=387 /DNA_ID=CAMNT_0038953951 /DNA_START=14 /DNA_END=1177 /DNA_ORIENTATION=+